MAFQRFKAGSDSAFTDHGIGGEDTAVPPDGQFYDGQENGQYSQAPFSGGEGQQGNILLHTCSFKMHCLAPKFCLNVSNVQNGAAWQ